jgi:pyridoxal phosphate enzyme (YggS family)
MINDFIKILKYDIQSCAEKHKRDLNDIKIVAVSKTFSVESIFEVLSNGFDCIGESKVQECEQKLPFLAGKYKEFHFIGHLQTNKINKLLHFKPDLIHSIDKYETALSLNKAVEKLYVAGQTQDILIEVNTSGEKSKNGVEPLRLGELINQVSDLNRLKIKGLMTIGANTDDTESIRKCFFMLRELFEKIKTQAYDGIDMQYLSMGMSDDYKIAIEAGSNVLRLGSVIFGNRGSK